MELSFREFCQQWHAEQNNLLTELVNISKMSQPTNPLMSSLIHRVIEHYQQFYDVKASFARQSLFPILSPQWNSPLENAFMWIGGWRPSTAIHLVYSVSGLQFNAKLNDILAGRETKFDLGDLSLEQLVKIDGLQRSTIKEERAITEEHAKEQEEVADAGMMELSHVIGNWIRGDDRVMMHGVDDRLDEAMKAKAEGLKKVLEKADDLRMRTLKGVIEILTPMIQAVHFLIGAAELQLMLHDWGKKEEEKQIDVQIVVQHPVATARVN